MGHDVAVFGIFRSIKIRSTGVEFIDYFLADYICRRGSSDKYKIVAANVADKIIAVAAGADGADNDARRFPDGLISVLKAVFVVIGFKLIQIRVADSKRRFFIDTVLELVDY